MPQRVTVKYADKPKTFTAQCLGTGQFGIVMTTPFGNGVRVGEPVVYAGNGVAAFPESGIWTTNASLYEVRHLLPGETVTITGV